MTKPSTTPGDITIITAADVRTILSDLDPEIALESQRQAFLALASQSTKSSNAVPSVQSPQRTTLDSNHMTSLFMPSRVADAGGMACKIVSVPKDGGVGGLPATTLLIDDVSGRVKAVINARRLTALRNACGVCHECLGGRVG